MKIACLQFAPVVGDVDNNMNRADAVLAKADPDDLDTLDLLVVPEMAFSGRHPAPSLDSITWELLITAGETLTPSRI